MRDGVDKKQQTQAAVISETDLLAHLEGVCLEAQLAAAAACAFLEAAGAIPPERRRLKQPTRPLPLDLVLKVGMMMRLSQWEASGLTPHLAPDLPTAQDVLADLGAPLATQRYTAEELARLVLRVRQHHLAWRPPANAADVVVAGGGAEDDLLDALALFLWEHRRLLNNGGA